ncbi:MAG: hypothetical protein WDW38_002368 [Sanguina aurantia]
MSALMAGRAAQRIASAASAKLAPRAVSMSTAAPVSRSGINFRTAAAATYQVPPMMLNAEGLQQPHGGKLVSLLAAAEDRAAIIKSATKTMELSDRNACDVELLAVGAFSPLEGFMNQENYDSVTIGMRLKSGLLFGIPIVLDTDREDVVVGDKVLLQYQGLDLAVVTIDSKWTPNKPLEALNVYGTSSLEHPAVQMVSMERGKYYMGERVPGWRGLPLGVQLAQAVSMERGSCQATPPRVWAIASEIQAPRPHHACTKLTPCMRCSSILHARAAAAAGMEVGGGTTLLTPLPWRGSGTCPADSHTDCVTTVGSHTADLTWNGGQRARASSASSCHVSVGVNLGALPTKGLTLPLISYGGSSMALTCAMAGVLLRATFEINRALDAREVRNRMTAAATTAPDAPITDDDIPGDVRFRTYEVLKNEVANPRLRWAYLPYSMHMAGPREAIQHMLIRKNYGATHFIIGRDMAGCKSSITGNDFYGAYDAQNLANTFAEELGMQTVASLNIAFTAERGYVTADVAKEEGLTTVSLSGTKFRQMLRSGADIPEWFAFKSVVAVLREQTSKEV